MNEVQAVKFWNAIQQGELIQSIPNTEFTQGYDVCKPTYTSALCEHIGLPPLAVPTVNYGYMGEKHGTINPLSDEAKKVADFLREVADKIESASTIKLD